LSVRLRLACVTALIAVGAFWAWSAAAPAEVVTRPPVVEETTWRATIPKTLRSPAKGPFLKGHRVGMFIEGGYCLGGPKPEFDHVTLVELPRTRSRPFRAAVITAYRRWPESSFTPPAGPDYGKCLPNRDRTIFHRVGTKRSASDLRLFDGYFSPPRQVWPPVKR
jgi:hypothetical protein